MVLYLSKLIQPCPSCRSRDLRLLRYNGSSDMWICFNCGESQIIVHNLKIDIICSGCGSHDIMPYRVQSIDPELIITSVLCLICGGETFINSLSDKN